MIGKINVGGAGAHTHTLSEIVGGDNLYNKDSVENMLGYFIDNDGTVKSMEGCKVSHKIEAKPNNYYIATCDSHIWLCAMAYDSNDNALFNAVVCDGANGFFLETPENTSYILICIANYESVNEADIIVREAALNETLTDMYSTLEEGISYKADTYSPTLEGAPKAPTPTATDNSTRIATTAYVQTALSDKASATDVANLQTAVNGKAPMHLYGTDDLVAGVSDLPSGTLYFVYE